MSAPTAGPGSRPEEPGRILVAMSGGVDSAVAAALLAEQGWEVAAITLKLYCYGEAGERARACCGLEGVRDAQGAARRLGIPHAVLDLEEVFREHVLEDFAAEYGSGRTPNPCVQCNTHVKFTPLLAWARAHGYTHVATGHYALRRCVRIEGQERVLIGRAADPDKDQSYVLWGIPARDLPAILFPLGGLTKGQVRARARQAELPIWDKEESQDICFVDKSGYAEVVRARLGADHPLFRPGEIRDLAGRLIGQHAGLIHYTVGQRRGLGPSTPAAYRVVALEPRTNILRVGTIRELGVRELTASDTNLFVPAQHLEAAPVEVRIRYRHPPARARAEVESLPGRTGESEGVRVRIRFEEPQLAVAPGQSCVVYRDGLLLAGGRIDSR